MRQQKNIYKYSGSGAPNVSGAPGLCPPSSIGCDATGDIRIKLLSTLLLSLQAANRLPLACLKVRPLKTDGSMGDMSPISVWVEGSAAKRFCWLHYFVMSINVDCCC